MQPSRPPTLDLSLPTTGAPRQNLLPDIRQAIQWRTWNEGSEEAALQQRPMMVIAEPHWSNSAQRIALRLRQDASLANLLDTRIVPVLIDPDERPDLVARWQWAAMSFTGTAGPPLIIFLTHEAQPFLAYCTMSVEGDENYPSLASMIESIAEAYDANSHALVSEATALFTEEATEVTLRPDWDALREMTDMIRGGLEERPKRPHPTLLWTALDAHVQGELPDDLVQWLETTLNAMLRGGIYDQLDRGFHRCSRDPRWVVPHFEKPIPLNAQLTAVYARAAKLFGTDTFRDIAARLASFCTAALHDNVDIVASDTGYYTWTSREVRTQLEPELLQVVSLHFDIQPIDERQALHRAIEMEQMDRYSHEDIDLLRNRLARGRSRLRGIRQRRSSPATVTLPGLNARAVTLRWLLVAAEWLDSVDSAAIIRMLDTLVDTRLDPERGYVRPNNNTAWLEDQIALLAAFLEAHSVSQETDWLDRAHKLGNILMSRYWSEQGWKDRPGNHGPSRAVIDGDLPAPMHTLTDALQRLAALTDDPVAARCASTTARISHLLASGCEHWSAALPVPFRQHAKQATT